MVYYKKRFSPNFTCETLLNPSASIRPSDPRIDEALGWLGQVSALSDGRPIDLDLKSFRPASSDASFRRYFRLDGAIHGQNESFILMDAPAPHEDTRPFIQIARLLAQAGLNPPKILAENVGQGFLLLSDLGSQTYLESLNEKTAPSLYRDAWRALIQMQCQCAHAVLPAYDEARLMQEMRLFDQWYLAKHLQKQPNDGQLSTLMDAYQIILKRCLAQPTVMVHRDFHSRNLMVTPTSNPGILDFQDAVMGPITYDLASLLRDAYISWPEEQQLDWAIRYWQDARKAGLKVQSDFGDFWADFEWMGLQRHLKVLGIFSRLYYRDGKDGYLNDIGLVLSYAQSVARRYVDLAPLARLMDQLHHA